MSWAIDYSLIKKGIQDSNLRFSCEMLHGNISCNKLALNCFFNTVKASYRTYTFVYLISVLMRIKTILKNYKQEAPNIMINLIKSICFTAIDMMIMRKILCLYNKYISFDSKSLIYANIIGGIALGVQSQGRQIQIIICIKQSIGNIVQFSQKKKQYCSSFLWIGLFVRIFYRHCLLSLYEQQRMYEKGICEYFGFNLERALMDLSFSFFKDKAIENSSILQDQIYSTISQYTLNIEVMMSNL